MHLQGWWWPAEIRGRHAQGSTNRSAYFPRGLWYSPYDGALAVDATEGARYVSLSVRSGLYEQGVPSADVVRLGCHACMCMTGPMSSSKLSAPPGQRGLGADNLCLVPGLHTKALIAHDSRHWLQLMLSGITRLQGLCMRCARAACCPDRSVGSPAVPV